MPCSNDLTLLLCCCSTVDQDDIEALYRRFRALDRGSKVRDARAWMSDPIHIVFSHSSINS